MDFQFDRGFGSGFIGTQMAVKLFRVWPGFGGFLKTTVFIELLFVEDPMAISF